MKLSNKIFLGIGFFDRTNNVLTDNVIHRPLTSYEHFQLYENIFRIWAHLKVNQNCLTPQAQSSLQETFW